MIIIKNKIKVDIDTARLLAKTFGDKIYNDIIITGKKHIYIDGKKIDLEVTDNANEKV